MNNKFLIPALLAVVSGCTSYTSTSLMTGTGSGSSGTTQKSSSPAVTTNTYPSYPKKNSLPSNISEDSSPSPAISKHKPPLYSLDSDSIQTAKHRTQEHASIESATVLNRPQQPAKSLKTSDPYALSSKKIKVEVIRTNSNDKVYLQLGVFSSLANAKILQKKVAANQMPEPVIKEIILNGKLAHRVQLGPIHSTAKVNEFNAKLMKIGISETWYVTESRF